MSPAESAVYQIIMTGISGYRLSYIVIGYLLIIRLVRADSVYLYNIYIYKLYYVYSVNRLLLRSLFVRSFRFSAVNENYLVSLFYFLRSFEIVVCDFVVDTANCSQFFLPFLIVSPTSWHVLYTYYLYRFLIIIIKKIITICNCSRTLQIYTINSNQRQTLDL